MRFKSFIMIPSSPVGHSLLALVPLKTQIWAVKENPHVNAMKKGIAN